MSEFYSGQHLSNLSLVNSKPEQDAQELIKKINLNSLKLYSKQNLSLRWMERKATVF